MPWNEPSVLIPAVSGLVGSVIGGLLSMKATLIQIKKQHDEAERQRIINEDRERQYVATQLNGLKLAISRVDNSEQLADVLYALRDFFLAHPGLLMLDENAGFYVGFLAGDVGRWRGSNPQRVTSMKQLATKLTTE
jgi:hypothetical protein